MEKMIQDYLTENYYVYNKGDYDTIYTIDSEYQTNGNQLLKDLLDIYGLEGVESKLFIYRWCIKTDENIDLSTYWEKEEPKHLGWSRKSGLQMGGVEFESLMFPMVQRIFSRTLASDIVEVKPMSSPKGNLFYMDMVYGELKPLTKYEKLKIWLESVSNKFDIFITKSLFIPINNNTFVTETK